MKTLITGSAGFIGSELALKLLKRGNKVVGIDNHNNYYDPKLKEDRLLRFLNHQNYQHLRLDLSEKNKINEVFSTQKPDCVVHLAAQAGVRYSLENPLAYVDSNLVGFAHILECCRRNNVQHLVFASSSSVYGANTSIPYSVHQNVDHPISLYAATKKSNELMAHAYSHIYGLPTTGLRFFTVYGPWGRPDMSPFRFVKSILEGEKIPVYNYGNHRRDFTFIDDIVEGVVRVLDKSPEPNFKWDSGKPDPGSSSAKWKIYNIGNQDPISLLDYISILEETIGKKAELELLPKQPGDVLDTYADVEDLVRDFNYQPKTSFRDGIKQFIAWYRSYYRI